MTTMQIYYGISEITIRKTAEGKFQFEWEERDGEDGWDSQTAEVSSSELKGLAENILKLIGERNE